MKRRCLFAVACAVWMFCASDRLIVAQSTARDYVISAEHSYVGFSIIKWMVVRETGRFRDFDGVIRYDPLNPAECRVVFTVRAESLDTGIPRLDAVLRSDDFFDTASFPTLAFRSVEVQMESAARLRVTGDLTIRGVTRRIVVPVSVRRTQGVAAAVTGFESRFTIDRTAFGVNGTRWSGGRLSLSREVDIELRVAGRATSATH